MSLDIREEAPTLTALAEHATIPTAFVVDPILEVRLIDGGLGGMSLTETAVTDPCGEDYDAIEGAKPTRWPERFDISNWGLICARRDGARAGGAVIAVATPGLNMLGGRDDVAVLWDIRVSPEERGAGIGSALFRAAGDWAGARGCAWLKIETQNVNAPACCFYQKMDCTLGAIDRFAYPGQPAEVQLLWRKALAPRQRDPADQILALRLCVYEVAEAFDCAVLTIAGFRKLVPSPAIRKIGIAAVRAAIPRAIVRSGQLAL